MFLIYSFLKDRVHVLVISAFSAFISVPRIITVFKINVCILIRFGLICHISIGKDIRAFCLEKRRLKGPRECRESDPMPGPQPVFKKRGGLPLPLS